MKKLSIPEQSHVRSTFPQYDAINGYKEFPPPKGKGAASYANDARNSIFKNNAEYIIVSFIIIFFDSLYILFLLFKHRVLVNENIITIFCLESDQLS